MFHVEQLVKCPMRVLTEIGEVGCFYEDKAVILRPSLYAISQIGEPQELVTIFADIMSDSVVFGECLNVIYSCCQSDEDLDVAMSFFGYYDDNLDENGVPVFHEGIAPVEHALILARCLLKHGMVGVYEETEREARKEKQYAKVFSPKEQVDIAIAHLGMNESEAWNLTMTSLVGALRSKFPAVEDNEPGAKAPTKTEYEAAMAWHDKVAAKRRDRNRKKEVH